MSQELQTFTAFISRVPQARKVMLASSRKPSLAHLHSHKHAAGDEVAESVTPPCGWNDDDVPVPQHRQHRRPLRAAGGGPGPQRGPPPEAPAADFTRADYAAPEVRPHLLTACLPGAWHLSDGPTLEC